MNTIKQKVFEIAPDLFAGSPVLFAYLYGSVAKDLTSPFSDLDIAVFIEDLDRKKSLDLELTLSLTLDNMLNHAIDSEIRIINYLPLPVKGDIISSGTLIFCRDDVKRVEFEASLRMSYFDFIPVIRHYQRERLGLIPNAGDAGRLGG